MKGHHDMILSELQTQANSLAEFHYPDICNSEKMLNAAVDVGQSSSGSWIGYQSLVYYRGFQKPPANAHFSKEWGFDNLADIVRIGSVGDWVIYSADDVFNAIRSRSGVDSIDDVITKCVEMNKQIDDCIDSVFSISQNQHLPKDEYVEKTIKSIIEDKSLSQSDFISYYRPNQLVSRDARAIDGGYQTPPHILIIASCMYVQKSVQRSQDILKLINKLITHIKNKAEIGGRMDQVSKNIFIGHGRSQDWRELKDFISDRLRLSWDEFNRVPVAGSTNVKRLAEMLDQACFAFLVMTAEDLTSDGKLNARLNVIHEAGLFQGRLGFDKAIILLENGCEEFSNVQGLGQIRFDKGEIKSTFEEVRRVLERSDVIKSV
jgi:predicted nucleotide-binding protein